MSISPHLIRYGLWEPSEPMACYWMRLDNESFVVVPREVIRAFCEQVPVKRSVFVIGDV